MLPVLTSVYLRGISGTLVGVATDRFRVAFHRHVPRTNGGLPHMEGDDFAILVPVTAIEKLLAVFRAVRSNNPVLTVTVESGTVTVTDGETSITVAEKKGTFPDLLKLLKEVVETEAGGTFGVNMRFLGDIAACAQRPLSPGTTIIRPHPTKPIVVQPHEALLFLVMPRKRDTDGEPVEHTLDLDSWVDLLGADK